MDIKKIDAILAARRILKADDKKDPKKPPEGYESWEEFNAAHPRGAGGRFGSGGSSEDSAEATSDQAANSVGKGEPGFIPPDNSAERKAFDKEFPIIDNGSKEPDDPNIAKLTASVAYSADTDHRTAGKIKDPEGNVLSLTNGFLDPRIAERSAGTTAVMAGSTGMVAGMVMGGGLVGGTVGGIIAGAMLNSSVRSSLEELATTKDFGSRIDTIGNVLAGRMMAMDEPKFTKVAPGVYKATYITSAVDPKIAAQKDIQMGSDTKPSQRHAVQLTVVSTYRGPAYAEKYPASKGWETSITNAQAGPSYTSTATQGMYRVSTLVNEMKANLPPTASEYKPLPTE